ncbi:MAG: hypothetical protein AAFN80_06925, partial [Pseudomonadota bacterium]
HQWGFPDFRKQVVTPIRKDLDCSPLKQVSTRPDPQKPAIQSDAQAKNSIYRRSTILHRRNHLRVVEQDATPLSAEPPEHAMHALQAPATSGNSESITVLLTAAFVLLLVATLIAVALYYIEIPTPSR